MRFSPRLGYLVLAITLIGNARADANIWDWLEELNGPGPSRSRGNFMFNLKCTKTDGLNLSGRPRKLGRFLEIPEEANTDTTCLFIDQRWLHAEEDDRFYPVNISITEVGTSAWLHETTELGAAIGVMKFSSRNSLTDQEFSGARMTITFPRLVFRPLLAIPSDKFKKARWGFFQVFFKESIVVGDLDQDDFASKPGNVFSRRHQRVESMGFIIDVTSLLNFR